MLIMPLLKLNNINVFYGHLHILFDISLEVEKGKFISVIGPNGAGKTTLLKTIIGFLKPLSGDIIFKDKKINKLNVSERVREGLTLVPEDKKIFPRLTVAENLEMGAYLFSKEEGKKQFREVYNLFPRLKERKNQLANTLSGGERQMLVIGRALMSKPELLMLDEPSTGLAPNLVPSLFKTIKKLQERKKITIILVEQRVKYALLMGSDIYIMEMGRLVSAENFDKDFLRSKYLGI